MNAYELDNRSAVRGYKSRIHSPESGKYTMTKKDVLKLLSSRITEQDLESFRTMFFPYLDRIGMIKRIKSKLTFGGSGRNMSELHARIYTSGAFSGLCYLFNVSPDRHRLK